MNKTAQDWFTSELDKIIASAQTMRQELDLATQKTEKIKGAKEVEETFLTEHQLRADLLSPLQEHPFGEVIDERWLAAKVISKEVKKNTAVIFVQFPDNLKAHGYWYDPAKIEVDDGFAWHVKENKFYIIQNQKWSLTENWMWNRIYQVPESVYNHISFKIHTAPPQDLLNKLEDELLTAEDMDLNPIKLKMKQRALNRAKLIVKLNT